MIPDKLYSHLPRFKTVIVNENKKSTSKVMGESQIFSFLSSIKDKIHSFRKESQNKIVFLTANGTITIKDYNENL